MMKLNLKVAESIKYGFATITILLVLIGAFTVNTFSNISELTGKVNTVSIPALINSSQLQVQFIKMGENALVDFYTTDLSELKTVEDKFATNKEAFDKESAMLKQVVADDPALAAELTKVVKTSKTFVSHVDTLFTTHREQLTLDVQIQEQYDNLEETIDDSSSLVLDITDASGFDSSAEDATADLETELSALLEQVQDLKSVKTAVDVNTVSNEITALADRIKQINAQIVDASKGDSAEFAQELDEKVGEIIAAVQGSSSIVNNKASSIEAYNQSKEALELSQQDISNGISQLQKLFNQATQVASDNQTNVSDSIFTAKYTTMIIGIIAVVLAFAISVTVAGRIVKPLAQVNSILKIVASGDLTQRLNDEKKDEFGELATNCNSLIDSLRTLIQGIISRSTQLAAASEETSAITTQTTQAIQEQRSEMEQAATATTEMSSTSNSVLASADNALVEIKHADDESNRVKSISQQNKDTISQLASEVEDASRVINKLHSDSASIGGILDVIRGIADQTNLLALNAAIEAARAGEQGRGFAVVADEVRSLASKTQESTQEIQAMIQVLQSGAEEAVDAMERGKRQADSCVEQTEVASQALISITNAVHQTHDANEQISHAAKEQSQVSREISERLESIVSIAEQTASGADQTAISSHEVARLSEELRLSVDEFKV